MSGLEHMSEQVKLQYSSLYGAYHPGVFEIGDHVLAAGVAGEVIWSTMSAESGMVYFIVIGNDWPVGFSADEITAE